MKKHAKVLIADDHALVRKGLREVVESLGGAEVVGEATNGLEAISMCKTECPDILTLDSGMPLARGIEVYGEVRRWCKHTRIIVITGFTSAGHLNQWIEAGVDGLLLKSSDPDDIRRALNAAISGERYISRDVASVVETRADFPALTNREHQILNLVADGHSNADIGLRLSISPKTVDNHRTRIMGKLGVHSVGQLIAFALREGLLDGNAQL